MLISRLSVGLRLGLSFVSILVITVLIAATGFSRIGSLQEVAERVATHEIEQQTLVEDWTSDIRLNWVRAEAFLKAIDPASVASQRSSEESKLLRLGILM